ncbi:hypothetical protein [Gemmatimonas sp.]|uniref:hypothetical protein n=1 Tax=Gemmatimonas sp. TaxID=1962908 RepID=UPI00286DF164|nr:hypothetical protein [Gemmatimonas sp.]
MRDRFRRVVIRTAAVSAAIWAAVIISIAVALPTQLTAQRRPGVAMGFYTTTGLLTGEVEGGSVSSSTAQAEAPTFALSALLTAPLKRMPKRAWIVGLRATPLNLGNNGSCYIIRGSADCQNRRFEEQAQLLTGGAVDIRSTVLRVMVGPALFRVEGQGGRVGTAVRLDLAAPRLRGSTPTIFYTGTFLGSQRGESLSIGTLGIGFRWVRKK